MAENKTQAEPLFSKKNIGLLKDPLTDSNPVTVQVLGICSALAITAELKASVIMGLSVIFVLGAGNVVISLFYHFVISLYHDCICIRVGNYFYLCNFI